METNESLWSASAELPEFPLAPLQERSRLQSDQEVADVIVIGGGITGLTAALLLSIEGRRVVLLEARRVGSGVSGRSTTHLTEAVDTRYATIAADFGKEGARLVAQSNRVAIDKVESLIARYTIGCDFRRRPGFLFTEQRAEVEALVKEHAAAREAGIAVERLAAAPLPWVTAGAIRFPHQAQMHIQRYLAGIATAASSEGAEIYEHARVVTIEDGDPCVVHLENGRTLRARHVFVATHAPLNRVLLQTKVAAYRSYVVTYRGIELDDGLFWDTLDPYHYFSSFTVGGTPWLILGGEDHRTGDATEPTSRFDALDRWARERMPTAGHRDADPDYRWSAQVEEPVDGLPFIGRNSTDENVFVATGFGGNGTTFGTIAAMLLSDHVVGRANPWSDLYKATRVKPGASASTFLRENIDFPIHLVSDPLHPPQAKELGEIGPGEGKTIRIDGRRLAVYREPNGQLHAVSSVCTHLGCLVKFNAAEKSWDCPCHGSRFSVDGEVLDGPATLPLASHSVSDPASPVNVRDASARGVDGAEPRDRSNVPRLS